jgi:hypothetical protein
MPAWLSRWLPPLVAFGAAFAVSAATSGGDPARVIASGAAAQPVTRTPVATELRSVAPLPDLHRRPPAAPRPSKRAAAAPVTTPAERTVATSPAPAVPQATAPQSPAAAPRPAATPLPVATPPPAARPGPAPQAPGAAPDPPPPTFDTSGNFDSSG